MDVDQAWRDLEVSAGEVVRLLVRLRNENALLQEKIDQLNRELEELGRDNQIKTGAVERLRRNQLFRTVIMGIQVPRPTPMLITMNAR